MARVLLVDTGFSAQPIREHLLKAGHEVWLVGARRNDALSRHDAQWIEGDYSKPGVIEQAVTEQKIDCLVPGCTDLSYLSCAKVAKQLGLPGFDHPEIVDVINQKHRLRQLGAELGLSMPHVFKDEEDWLDQTVIIKPVDSFSGKGVIKATARSRIEQKQMMQEALHHSPSGQLIVEEFAQGQLYSHSCMLVKQKVVSEAWVKELSGANPWVVDTSYLDEESVSELIKTEVRRQIQQLAGHLGLKDGLLHTQLIIGQDGFWLIEMTRRCPGDLYSQLLELSIGAGYVADYCATFTGTAPVARGVGLPKIKSRQIMRHTLSQTDTLVFNGIVFKHPLNIRKWVPLAMTGDQLQPSPMGRIAILFAQCKSREDLLELAELAVSRNLYELEASHA